MAQYSGDKYLPLSLSRGTGLSLHTQIAEQIRALIVSGRLRAGDHLPSSRTLAHQLEVSRGTVVFAYEQLTGEGYLSSNRGGTRVSRTLLAHWPQDPAQPSGAGQEYLIPGPASVQVQQPETSPPQGNFFDLRPGQPDTSLLASASWRAAWRTAVAAPLSSHPPAGSLALRSELAEHLRLIRATYRDPEELLITAGAREGFRLLLTALRARQRKRPLRVAVENPGYPNLRKIPQTFGHQIIPIPVDSCGLIPDCLPVGKDRPDLVLLAPNHQYPLGTSMPVSRRLDLLAWSAEQQVLLVEDDYDSELRYRGDPLPTLAALDRSPLLSSQLVSGRQSQQGRVLTLGSFSKLLAPGLKLGYLLAPPQLAQELLDLRDTLGNPVPCLVQDALAHFLARGGLRSHTARMSRVYRRRRELVREALGQIPGVKLVLMEGGLHAMLILPGQGGLTETCALERAREVGVVLAPLSDYWSQESELSPGSPLGLEHSQGLVLGFGALKDQDLALALERLRFILMRPSA
ncbi:PLP-dependent aminotransferase family protein [Rothia sp. P5764]|uniref:MocR-like pyridoxine biosynthesis transcription factor PdxR n=1 Tax=Rothia sp. P5764 TaxID=3402654 RepID=UPI003AC1C1C8